MEELFDRATNSDVKADVKNPHSSSHINSKTSQENHRNKAVGNATCDNPYPSQPKYWILTKAKSDKADKCTPMPWASPELYESQKSEGKCIRCWSPKYTIFQRTKYIHANFPKKVAPPGDRTQTKWWCSVNSQQPEIYLISLTIELGEGGWTKQSFDWSHWVRGCWWQL